MMKNRIAFAGIVFVLMLLVVSGKSFGQDFVYEPINPAFGGSPLNYSWLLSSANAQNLYQNQSSFNFGRDPLANFEDRLQRQILYSLTRDLIDTQVGDIDLSKQSSFKFGNFSIDIFPGPSGIDIVIVNSATGERTTITIPSI